MNWNFRRKVKEYLSTASNCDQTRLMLTLPDNTRQLFRWVNDLSYIDSENRPHTLNALLCVET